MLSKSEEELPILVEAKRFRGGDFWPTLRAGIEPFFRGDPRELLATIATCGMRELTLLVDALNECPSSLRAELLTGIQAFVVQYEGRVVITSQIETELTGDTIATVKILNLPDAMEKRAIYAYHAGMEPNATLDYLCSAFTNAYWRICGKEPRIRS